MTLLENLKSHIASSASEDVKNSSTSKISLERPLPSSAVFLNKLSKKQNPAHPFEETYKSSYSHGLENIYALENIDPKSIRKIEARSESKITTPKRPHPQRSHATDQPEFDFGMEHRKWIDSFLPREPIQVLGLLKHAEKRLIDLGKTRLKDILETNLQDFAFSKGMGQGHIDEIQEKLSLYLQNKDIWQSQKIDFASWMRCLITGIDRKKIAVFLREFNLADLVPLSLAETVEVNRLSFEQRQEWIQQTIAHLHTAELEKSVHHDMKQVVDVFVKPWVRGRLGLATEGELLERIERMSETPAIAKNTLSLLSAIYFKHESPFAAYLPRKDEILYCVDQPTAMLYSLIIETTYSYFYKPQICYNLPQLVKWVESELAKSWIGLKDGFTEKVIRFSPHFRTRKGDHGLLFVRLA